MEIDEYNECTPTAVAVTMTGLIFISAGILGHNIAYVIIQANK